MLIVAQISPPSEIVAARRTAGLAKWLGRRGHRVTVLTSRRSGEGGVHGAVATVRTHDLAATRLNWRRPEPARALSAPTGPVRGIEAHVVPDMAVISWLPFALPRAMALARRDRFDCVITSSPPPSAHLIGPALQRLGVHWIADIRDGWTAEAPRPSWPLALEERMDSGLERELISRADGVMAVTGPIVDDLNARLGVRARLLPNGYDPEERARVQTSWADGLLAQDRHSLVHTGRAAMSEVSPTVVLDALRELCRTSPEVAGRLEVVFAGPQSQDELRELSDPALRAVARSVGSLDRDRALALQQAADSLLVITTGPRERSLATGKLFEYLTAGPPILVVGDRSEAASIVSQTGTGFAVPSDSPAAVAEGIRRLVSGAPIERDPEAIARYSWARLGERASELIEEVCAARPKSGH